MTIWYVVGGIVLAALVVVGLVAVNRRASLRRAEERRQLPSGGTGSGARTGGEGDGGSVDVRDRPTVTEPADTGPETDVGETDVLPEAVETLPLDRPEAPESRLARLRRRLAGSNNSLSRGLLMLLSRDRIDEDTWEEFEEVRTTPNRAGG